MLTIRITRRRFPMQLPHLSAELSGVVQFDNDIKVSCSVCKKQGSAPLFAIVADQTLPAGQYYIICQRSIECAKKLHLDTQRYIPKMEFDPNTGNHKVVEESWEPKPLVSRVFPHYNIPEAHIKQGLMPDTMMQ